MKKVFFLLLSIISISCFAQKSDTLNVPLEKYKFLKVGDKVYKVVTTLEEVIPQPSLLVDTSSLRFFTPFVPGTQYWPYNVQPANTSPIYLLNNANKSEQFTN